MSPDSKSSTLLFKGAIIVAGAALHTPEAKHQYYLELDAAGHHGVAQEQKERTFKFRADGERCSGARLRQEQLLRTHAVQVSCTHVL